MSEAFDGKHCPACGEPVLEKARKPDGQEAFFCVVSCRWLGGQKEAEDLLALKAYIEELEDKLREKDPLAGVTLSLALAEPQAHEKIATVQIGYKCLVLNYISILLGLFGWIFLYWVAPIIIINSCSMGCLPSGTG